MTQWLLNRLFEAKDQPKPRFAFHGTVNWMHALAILVQDGSFDKNNIKSFYAHVSRRTPNPDADTVVFENMLMAYHNHAALNSINEDIEDQYDTCRTAIINWYYSTYFTCSAMIAAASGSTQETHSNTSKVWQSDIVNSNLVMSPFNLTLSSLVEKKMKTEVAAYKGTNTYDLNIYAADTEEAWGAITSYLKGTWDYEKWRIEERVKKSSDFKKLGVSNFRTKVARECRDKQLAKHGVNFLIQAFRYRGKANYRDSIFLSYGYDNTEKIEAFVEDLQIVSHAFQCMAACYLSRRVERGTWTEFIDDLGKNTRLSLEPSYLAI